MGGLNHRTFYNLHRRNLHKSWMLGTKNYSNIQIKNFPLEKMIANKIWKYYTKFHRKTDIKVFKKRIKLEKYQPLGYSSFQLRSTFNPKYKKIYIQRHNYIFSAHKIPLLHTQSPIKYDSGSKYS